MASLAVKYRPKTFDQIVEQTLVIDMVKALCEQKELSNRNFLFTGSAGTGKTTTCRCIANVLNDGQGEPIEIDAATHGNVESIREIVAQAKTYPVGCKYKIFIVDEVHAISPAGWSAFLKCLEESPAKTVFLFATTNPEKIPATILSRVQVFQLSKISLQGIYNRLVYVIEEENKEGRGITYTEDAVNFIAKLAGGGMRDALTLLDKALAYSNELTSENLAKALNLPNYDNYFELLSAYARKDNTAIATIIHNVYNSGVNFIKWFEAYHSFIIQILKYIYLQDINMTTIPSHYSDKISKYNVKHANICLKLANILVKMNSELKTTQYLQELSLTYLCSINKDGTQ